MKAIFTRDVEIRSRVYNVAWSIKASPIPQTFPRECVLQAVARGAAEIVPPRRKTATGPEQRGDVPPMQPPTQESE